MLPTISDFLTENVNLRPIPKKAPHIIGIGASTGGPEAIRDLLINLKNVKVPILITQHIPHFFSDIFVENLRRVLDKPIVNAKNAQEIEENMIYIAPGGYHMVVCPHSSFPNRIMLSTGMPENFCKPSVDPMFRSIAKKFRQNVLGVVLTGIGQDGLKGSIEIVNQGGFVLAQDKESSVVWGMPRAIVDNNLASLILPPTQIGEYITLLCNKHEGF